MALTLTKLGMAVAASLIMVTAHWGGVAEGAEAPARKGPALEPLAGLEAPAGADAPGMAAWDPIPDDLSVPEDEKEKSPTRRAAEEGDAKAQYSLGSFYEALALMYEAGINALQDSAEEAIKWYRKAAEQGLAVAQRSLGDMYAQGLNIPQDFAEAVRWYRMAAEQGLAEAQRELGGAYRRGEGAPQDYAEALKWLSRAAEQSDVPALCKLGDMYENGEGVSKNFVQAYMWYELIEILGGDYSPNSETHYCDPRTQLDALLGGRSRDRLAYQMTPAEITLAQQLAWAWMGRYQLQG